MGGSTSCVLESAYECESRLRKKAYEEPVSGGDAWGSCKGSPGSATAPERRSATALFGETARFEDAAAPVPEGPADDPPSSSFVLDR